MKLLIIEGPDRVGKNLLIQQLTAQAENYVVRHWGTARGKDDWEKRDSQFQFFKKEFELASQRSKFEMPDRERYPRDIWIWNRAHLGEFVYGRIYRNTNPEEWVMQMEKLYGMDLDPSVYLLLLTASPDFLCKRDDGKSFSSDIEKRTDEIAAFIEAWIASKILNKKIVDVSFDGEYRDKTSIVEEVNQFLKF